MQERLAPSFERAEPRQRAIAYIRGEFAHHRAKKRMEAPLNWREKPDRMGCTAYSIRPDFDADQVRDDLQHYILTHLADPEAVLVVDETGKVRERHQVSGRGSPI